ncbi:MAG: ribonuclease J [Hyphomicrobiaceae bacterium]|nr:ribonuclease J [Hyphomicrobiaceae bacterium]
MARDRGRSSGGAEQGGDEFVLVALGGMGEIGMNAYLYGYGPAKARNWLLVDLGITFPEGEFDPGVDVILPDLRFLEEDRASLSGIVLTHAHEDHVGAVIDLWPRLEVPIYATPFTAGMLKAKAAEFGGRMKLPINVLPMGGRTQIGPFEIELITMSHSIPEPSAVAIRTPAGLALHTGDWKLDQTPFVGDPPDERRLETLGGEGVRALICDSTNAMRDGRSPSESDIASSIAKIVKAAPKRVAITTFSSNVARIKAVADAATASGRTLVVAGRAMHRVIEVARETGYLPEDFRYVDQQQFKYIDRSKVLLLCTGSQGEPRAAMARMADNDHPDVQVAKGDLVVFSSRTIPGNEKDVGRIQNAFVRMGCEVLTDAEALVHVTGHPRRDELKQMYQWIKPELAVPMHGEARHIRAHAELARAAGVPEVMPAYNGEMVRLAPGPAAIIDDVPVGRLFRDGRLIVSSIEGPVRDRRRLAIAGICVVALVMSDRGEVLADPEIVLDGVPEKDADGEEMYDVVADAVDGALDSMPQKRRKDVETVREAVRRAARAAIGSAWGKKPVCKVLISVIDD